MDDCDYILVPRWAFEFVLANADFADEGSRCCEAWSSEQMKRAREALEKANEIVRLNARRDALSIFAVRHNWTTEGYTDAPQQWSGPDNPWEIANAALQGTTQEQGSSDMSALLPKCMIGPSEPCAAFTILQEKVDVARQDAERLRRELSAMTEWARELYGDDTTFERIPTTQNARAALQGRP
jgi:hypothetical protein